MQFANRAIKIQLGSRPQKLIYAFALMQIWCNIQVVLLSFRNTGSYRTGAPKCSTKYNGSFF